MSERDGIGIAPAAGPADLAQIRILFREYAQALGVCLCFQGFEAELAGLPGKYAPPAGQLLLARLDGDAVGCVAMHPLDGVRPQDALCEMKRLYVRPGRRGWGLGRRLAEAIVDAARVAGHRAMRLDTLERLTQARALYEAMGFVPIAAYYDNPLPGPLPGVLYYGKPL